MATQKNALAVCDECGFVYPHRVMRLNSYGMLVCPQDFEGQYDLKNHPQNKIPNTIDVETLKFPTRRSPMPETNVTVTDWLPD